MINAESLAIIPLSAWANSYLTSSNETRYISIRYDNILLEHIPLVRDAMAERAQELRTAHNVPLCPLLGSVMVRMGADRALRASQQQGCSGRVATLSRDLNRCWGGGEREEPAQRPLVHLQG